MIWFGTWIKEEQVGGAVAGSNRLSRKYFPRSDDDNESLWPNAEEYILLLLFVF